MTGNLHYHRFRNTCFSHVGIKSVSQVMKHKALTAECQSYLLASFSYWKGSRGQVLDHKIVYAGHSYTLASN